ncbi:MAG: YihY/virulence factor BrkB family protein [Jiangellaceae bacterium]
MTAADALPGERADEPTEVPPRGWWQIVRGAWSEAKKDQIPLISAGVAFYAFLSLFPTLIAVVLIYGLVSDPEDVADQIDSWGAALPAEAESLLTNQMESVAGAPQRSLGFGLVIALAAALWSASGGIGNLITAINIAYGGNERRGFVKRRALALGFALTAIVFLVLAVALVAAAPAVIRALDLPSWAEVLVHAGRWLGLMVAVMVALALLYRWAPIRDRPRFRWVSVGSVVATVLWLAGSVGFSLFVDNFGSYGETYGALAGVVVLMLWLWLTVYATLFGAEINAEAEVSSGRGGS